MANGKVLPDGLPSVLLHGFQPACGHALQRCDGGLDAVAGRGDRDDIVDVDIILPTGASTLGQMSIGILGVLPSADEPKYRTQICFLVVHFNSNLFAVVSKAIARCWLGIRIDRFQAAPWIGYGSDNAAEAAMAIRCRLRNFCRHIIAVVAVSWLGSLPGLFLAVLVDE